jgi:gluconolactonase
MPNGVGLSPDESTLYVAETPTARLWAFDLVEPGQAKKLPWPSPHGGRFIAGSSGYQRFDSLAVEEDGQVCVATLVKGGISIVSPETGTVDHVPFPDRYTTNICFGGDELRTAYITLSQTGQLIEVPWPRPGLALNYLNK